VQVFWLRGWRGGLAAAVHGGSLDSLGAVTDACSSGVNREEEKTGRKRQWEVNIEKEREVRRGRLA
jgi:hypothetical protein